MTSFLLFCSLNGQDYQWKQTSSQSVYSDEVQKYQHFDLFQLENSHKFIQCLADTNTTAHQISVKLPVGLGEIARVQLSPAPILPPNLRAKYPNIRTFRVQSVENPSLSGRISIGTNGIFAHLVNRGESVFVEPFSINLEEKKYRVYRAKDVRTTAEITPLCGNSWQEIPEKLHYFKKSTPRNKVSNLRTFRLAVTTTEAFSEATGTDIPSVLSTIVNSVNSLNVIYERDLGIQFLLHPNTDQLIFTDQNPAPFSDSEGAFELWGEHIAILDSLIDPNSYDIGHVFAANCTGGVAGLASLASVCSSKIKANGVSCLFRENIADFRRTLYHEIGHQLGANHTWSNCGRDVNESQRNPATAVEPGSGSTIMSYGGLCGALNIVPSAHDNLHGISILEIEETLSRDTINCFQELPIDNTPPFVTVRPSGFTIPILTPFELLASGFDEDDTRLTYSWEQLDTGAVSEISTPVGNAPSFRSFVPTRDPLRIFPRVIDIILNNESVNEILPDTTRQLTFGVTVRDNDERGGTTAFEIVSFAATETAGPFLVTAPDTSNIIFETGDSVEVSWNVAGTNLPPVNCLEVDIYLSLNNGQVFPILLTSSISNNGQTKVKLPDETSNRARIKVKCADNIFFDMSNNRFRIIEKLVSSTKELYKQPVKLYPNPVKDILTLEMLTTSASIVQLRVVDALGRLVLVRSENTVDGKIQLPTNQLPSGVYFLEGVINEQFFTKRFVVQ
ncbi:MAG: zinc-dependent metalloprotease [Bacteroidota bacterium]